MTITLRPELLTKQRFAPYGDVIETSREPSDGMNEARFERFDDLCKIDLDDDSDSDVLPDLVEDFSDDDANVADFSAPPVNDVRGRTSSFQQADLVNSVSADEVPEHLAIVDSGASGHIWTTEDNIYDVRQGRTKHFKEPGGNITRTNLFGNVRLRSIGVMNLENVSFIPEYGDNIISVSALIDAGYTPNFTEDGGTIVNPNGVPVGKMVRAKGLFFLVPVQPD